MFFKHTITKKHAPRLLAPLHSNRFYCFDKLLCFWLFTHKIKWRATHNSDECYCYNRCIKKHQTIGVVYKCCTNLLLALHRNGSLLFVEFRIVFGSFIDFDSIFFSSREHRTWWEKQLHSQMVICVLAAVLLICSYFCRFPSYSLL